MHDILRETPIYQEILKEGREEGLEQGLQRGQLEALRQAIVEVVVERRVREIGADVGQVHAPSIRRASCSATSPGSRSTKGSRGRWPGFASTVPRTPTKTARPRTTRSSRRTPSSAGSPARPCPPVSVLALFGPTASGKTAVAEAVADRIGGEVVSADSMQAYRGLPILTAQPERPTRLVA